MDRTALLAERIRAHPESTRRPSKPSAVHVVALGRQVAECRAKLSHCDSLARRVESSSQRQSLFSDPGREIDATAGTIKATLAEVSAGVASMQQSAFRQFARTTAAGSHWEAVFQTLNQLAEQVSLRLQRALRTRALTVRQRAANSATPGNAIVSGKWVPPAEIAQAAETVLRASTPSKPARNPFLRAETAAEQGPASSSSSSTYMRSQLRSVAVHRRAIARHEEAEELERTAVEVGHVVQHMAHVVAAQGETIERIDSQVHASLDNINAAQQELYKLLNVVSRNRPLLIALLVVGALLVVSIAWISQM
jgi:syntaxin 5